MRKFDDGPAVLTDEEAEFVTRWLNDQLDSWRNVGDREMMNACELLLEQVEP